MEPASDVRAEANSFSFHETKDGRVRIAWRGRVVTTLSGADAARFLARIASADETQRQLAMAKVTGSFKRGNERATGSRYRERSR